MIKIEKVFDMTAKNYENLEEKRFKQYTDKIIVLRILYLVKDQLRSTQRNYSAV